MVELIGLRSDTASQLSGGRTASVGGVAAAVDVVAASPQVSEGSYTVSADAIRIDSDAVALRREGTVTNERFADHVTPVCHGTLLWELLRGARPDHLFETVDGFERSINAAQSRKREWRTDVETIRIRPVRWRGVEATLVGT
ncbi:DUF7283 family protein [Natranaeroarchaeum aerophilus]|uniref:Uncharacterized protein n=1 Tax=Natranaeroarchaeum aerophilus TaxID=2917711 RepID=A0AAE3FT19_9EURY|nr:hypothetical protein [Natranaeroarchaeum aerophilus]MCL9814808.1 hypothetical protein [Natranaeroarchaeum aerophilus]